MKNILTEQLVDDLKRIWFVIVFPLILAIILKILNYVDIKFLKYLTSSIFIFFNIFAGLIYMVFIIKNDYIRFGKEGSFLKNKNENEYLLARLLRYVILIIFLIFINLVIYMLAFSIFFENIHIIPVAFIGFIELIRKMNLDSFLIWFLLININLIFFSSLSILVVNLSEKYRWNLFGVFVVNLVFLAVSLILIAIISSFIPIDFDIGKNDDLLNLKFSHIRFRHGGNIILQVGLLQFLLAILSIKLSKYIND